MVEGIGPVAATAIPTMALPSNSVPTFFVACSHTSVILNEIILEMGKVITPYVQSNFNQK